MEQITKADEALGAKIQDLMFVFDNLIEVDDRGMQELLRQVPSDQLLIALKGADETLKAKIFKNMSQRAAEMLKDDLEAKGPVRLSEVEGGAEGNPRGGAQARRGRHDRARRQGRRVCLSVASRAARWAAARRSKARSSAGAPMRPPDTRARSSAPSHARGYQAGLAAGARGAASARSTRSKTRIARLDAILKLLARPLEELDAEVEQQLTLLALTVGKQIVRRELKTDPAQIIGVIRESVARLPAAARDIRVHLHPEDAAVVRENLATPTARPRVVDRRRSRPGRGGCLVRTDTSQIDARLDSRLNAIVSAALGDERSARSLRHEDSRRNDAPPRNAARIWRERLARHVRSVERIAAAARRRLSHAHGRPHARSRRLPGRDRRLLRRASPAAARASKPKSSDSPATACFSCPPATARPRAQLRASCRASAPARCRVGPQLLGPHRRRRRATARRPRPARLRRPRAAHRASRSIRSRASRSREPLDVGVRSINSLLTVGRGQRIGLFAGSGVGKSVLLGMMARYTSADIIVVGLIGERGREVKEFVERILGPKDRKRAVVVATPADNPPLMRLHGAWLATAIAEYFRDRGKNVLLIMDSLTRFAQAQREIGLAIGEAPATKGYPPSVFARLPQLVERAGNGTGKGGSITAFYTVLTEGDDQQRSDRRCGARHSRRPHRAVAAHRRKRALSGDRRRSVRQPRDARDRPGRPVRARAALPPYAFHLPAASRPHRHRRLSARQRPARRCRHRAVAEDAEIPAAGHARARRSCDEPRSAE